MKKIIYPLMSKWKFLGEYEKRHIDAYFLIGKNFRQIGAILDRSRTSIRNYLPLKNVNIITNKKGRKGDFSFRTVKKIQSMGSNKAINISKIKADLDLSVLKSTVLRAIKEDNNLVYKKMRQSSNLKEVHKLKRVDFALDKILWTRHWHKVIFSDKKI